jgi:hypothetical protein
MTRVECQEALFEIALELTRQDKRLAEIGSALDLPPDADSMFEMEIPSTVEVELFSRIETVKRDYFEPAIEALLVAAQLNDAAVRHEFARTRSRLDSD